MATRSTSLGLVLLVGLLGGVGGGVGSYLALREAPSSGRSERPRSATRTDTDVAMLRELASIRAEFAAMRSEHAGRVATQAKRTERGSVIEIDEAPTADADATKRATLVAKFDSTKFAESLRTEPFGIELSDKLLTKLSINKDLIGPTIAALKKELENDPENPDLWSALGAAHTAKLASGEVEGPAAGAVFGEVKAAYDEALKFDENHWTARYSIALTTSMAPEFIGLRPQSIRMFEDVVQRQEARPNSPEYARSYIRLGTLYKDAGNAEKAKEVWKKGLRLYPDDRQLSEAIAVAEKK